MSKPIKCCFPNCENCPYTDCKYNDIEYEDIKRQDEFDRSLEIVEPEIARRRRSVKKYNSSEKRRASQAKYAQSKKGKMRTKKYNSSQKGKESRKRYSQSTKGIAAEKRKQKKKIESGKNAEYCRAYYYRKKLLGQS